MATYGSCNHAIATADVIKALVRRSLAERRYSQDIVGVLRSLDYFPNYDNHSVIRCIKIIEYNLDLTCVNTVIEATWTIGAASYDSCEMNKSFNKTLTSFAKDGELSWTRIVMMLATAVTLAEKAFDDGWYDRIQLILNWTEKLFCENHVNAWIRASQGWEGIITCPQLLQTCSTRDASPPPNRQGRSHTTQRKDLADCIPGNSRSRSSPAFIPETFDCNIQKQPTNVDPQCIVYPESNQFKHYMNLTNLECSLLKLRATEGFSGVPTTKMKEPIDCGTAPVQPSALDRNGEMPGAKYSDDEGDWVNLDEECRESESEGEKFQEKNCEISGFRFFPPPLEMGCYNLKDNEDFRFDEDLADCSKETKRGNRQPHSAKRPRTKKPKRLIQKIQHPEYQKPCFFNEGLHRQKTHKKTEFLGAPCEDALLPEKQDSKTKPASPTRADKENKNCGEVLPNQVPSEDKTEEAQSEDNSATGSPAAESTSSTMDSVDDNAAAGDDDVRPESDSLYVSAQTENAGLESVV